jgi:hypothetical protein
MTTKKGRSRAASSAAAKQEERRIKLWGKPTQQIADEVHRELRGQRRSLRLEREAQDILRDRMRYQPRLTKNAIKQARKDALQLLEMEDAADRMSTQLRDTQARLFRQRAEARGFVVDENGDIIGSTRARHLPAVTVSRAPDLVPARFVALRGGKRRK